MHNPSSKNLSLSDFEILNKLGKGSFGVVYKVKRKSNKSTYVLKQINISSMKSKMRSIALNEVKILSSLENPYVVKYYDSFIEQNNLNIIMEYCEGGDLAQYIKGHMGKPLSEPKIWKFFIQMCIGMSYIHSKKILHRDIKSLNIFLTKDGDIRIGDLGVAKVLAESVSFAHTMVGTPYYLSPEMCEERPYNEKSDIWALGCVLYEMCTQKHPFQAHSQGTLILKIIKGHYTPISGTYSSDLAEIVNLCLNKDYKKRWTASALLTKPSMIEKAKSLSVVIPELDKKPIGGLQPIVEESNKAKENKSKDNKRPKDKTSDQVAKNPLARREDKAEKKPKEQDNNEGKINVFGKIEAPKIEPKANPISKPTENKVAAVEPKNIIPKPDPTKVEFVKLNAEVKPSPAPVNEKPESNPARPSVPQKHRENALGPEVIAKGINDGKKAPYIVVSGEKIVNKDAPVVNKVEDRNAQRVRKGAPSELGRQAKIAGSQQKLVKKVGNEPMKINRPALLEDKEKAPIGRPSLEQNKGSQRNLQDDQNAGPTEKEIDEVKNLPDIVKPNLRPKEVITPQNFNVFGREQYRVGSNAIQRPQVQKPISEEKLAKPKPVVEIAQKQEPVEKKAPVIEKPAEIDEELKIEEKAPKEEKREEIPVNKVAEDMRAKPVEEPQHEEENEENEGDYEEEAETNDEEVEGGLEEQEQDVPRRNLDFGYNAFQKVNWKISEGERNAKIVRRGDAEDVEEYKTFDPDLNDREESFEEEENNEEEEENDDIQEESNEESEEENEDENNQEEVKEDEEDLRGLSRVVLEKRLNKAMRKREKIKDLVKDIRANQYIKSLGEERFGQIIDYFRLKLESDDEINEEDQDEIERFLRGKLPADIQVQVIYNIYRLLGLQIELQKCEEDVKKYTEVLA